MLEAWMARKEIAPVLARYVVVRKLDVDRTLGGPDVIAACGGKDSGLPWFAVLDGAGQVLADSGKGEQNIGCPYKAEEIAAFGQMLRTVAPQLSAEDWGTLQRSLTAQREEMEKRAR